MASIMIAAVIAGVVGFIIGGKECLEVFGVFGEFKADDEGAEE